MSAITALMSARSASSGSGGGAAHRSRGAPGPPAASPVPRHSSAQRRPSHRPLSSGTVLRQRQRPQQVFFWAGRHLERFLENLDLQRLLAEQTLKFAYLFLLRAERGSRHDLLLRLRCRQRALLCQPAPGEELVRRNATATRHETHGGARFTAFRDHLQLLDDRPAPPPFRTLQHFGLRIRTIHRHGITPDPYFKGGPRPGN